MPGSVAEQLDSAARQIGDSGAGQTQTRTAEVDKGLGGADDSDEGGAYAPVFIRHVSKHVARLPGLFGKKNLGEILGQGDLPNDGATPPWVHPSINLRDRKSFTHVSPELKELLLDLKKDFHNCEIQRQCMVHQKHLPITIQDTPYFKHVLAPKLKAFSLTDFSAWVPTLNTAFYFEELDLDPVIDSYFPDYPMPSRTVTVPGALTRMKGRLEADTATFTQQYNTSSSYSMTAQDCVAHTDITEDLMQDMVPNAGGFERLRREVAMGVARSKEDAIINGDDTGSVQGDGHMDSDVAGGAATLFNKAFKGLRKRALAASATYDNGGAGVALATYNGLIPVLGKFAKEKGDLLLIVGPTIANKIVCGNVPEILTHEKFGPNNATISSGVLPKVFGIEQYESEWVREDVNSSGVYASAQSLTTVLLVKKSRFVMGRRQPLRIWATPSLASSDKLLLSAKERFVFGGTPQSATEKSVAAAINVALT